MHIHVGDIIVLNSSTSIPSCDTAREVVYVGPGLICLCNLMYDKTITTYGHKDINIQEFLYHTGDENETKK